MLTTSQGSVVGATGIFYPFCLIHNPLWGGPRNATAVFAAADICRVHTPVYLPSSRNRFSDIYSESSLSCAFRSRAEELSLDWGRDSDDQCMVFPGLLPDRQFLSFADICFTCMSIVPSCYISHHKYRDRSISERLLWSRTCRSQIRLPAG